MFERFSIKGGEPENSGSERTMVLSVSPMLFVLSGEKKGRRIKIDKDTITMGRGKANDVCFENDNSVSQKHAAVSMKEGKWLISGAGGGIVVDGQEVNNKILEDGSVIELGGVRLRFEEGRSTAMWRLQDRSRNRKHIYRLVIMIVFLGIILFVMRFLSSMSSPKVTRHMSEDTCLHFVPVVEEPGVKPVSDASEKCYIMGMAEYNRGSFENAAFYWKEALKVNPGHENAKIKLNALEEEKKKSAARRRNSRKSTDKEVKREDTDAGRQRKHETAEMYYRKGRVFLAANDSKKALYYWKKTLKIIDDPNDELYRQAMEKVNSLSESSRR